MPKVKDLAGNVVAELPYTDEGMEQADIMADTNPNWDVEMAPGGMYNAMDRSVQEYAGGGKVGYNKIGMYKKGGKVKKK